MSLAWEVSVDDIAIVLFRKMVTIDPDEVFDKVFVGDTEYCERVEQAALRHIDFDGQCDAALDEITSILKEVGVIPN